MEQYYVYILLFSDDTYYVGLTNDIERRLFEHESLLHPRSYTASRLPVKLVYCEPFYDARQAIAYEKKIKKWSHGKKEALIQENWHRLKELAACRNSSHSKNLSRQ